MDVLRRKKKKKKKRTLGGELSSCRYQIWHMFKVGWWVSLSRQIVLKKLVSKLELGLAAVHPRAFIVEEPISALFKFLVDHFGLLVPLEPCLVLLVKPPTKLLQPLGCEVLLIRSLTIVEDIKKGVRVHLHKQVRLFKNSERFLRIVRRCFVRRLRLVAFWPFRILCNRQSSC